MRALAISIVVGMLGGQAVAADQSILGKTFQVKDGVPGGDPTKRKVVGLGKEKASPNTIVGNPTVSGASLQIVADAASQVFALPQGTTSGGNPFWKATSTGYVYKDSAGEQSAVKTLVIKRSASGNFVLKAVLLSKVQPITVLPPNPGSVGFAALTLNGGDRYCMQYGGAAGGVVSNAGPKLFKVTKPTVEGGCPPPASTTSTSTTTSTTTTTLCANQAFNFGLSSNSGGTADPAEWPGGTQQGTQSGSCFVQIDNPSGNIDLVGNLGDNFSVLSTSGFSNCFGQGGEDGDGCSVGSCPPAGIGSCEAARPSCSAALNGSAGANYHVQCLQ